MDKLKNIFKRNIGFYYCSLDWREAIVKEIQETYGDFIIYCKKDSYAVTIEIAGDTIIKILDVDDEDNRGYEFDEVYVEASLKSDIKMINTLVTPSIYKYRREKTVHFIGIEKTVDFYFD